METGTIVGLVIFVLFILIIIGLIAYFYWQEQQASEGNDVFPN